MTVYYQLSGTASNGVDYTNLTGQVTLAANGSDTIYIHPITDNVPEGIETVVLTLFPTNTYLIQPSAHQASIELADSPISVLVYQYVPEGIEPNGPPGAPAQVAQLFVQRTDYSGTYPAMTVNYTMSGTASNGVDYTALSGTINFAASAGDYFRILDVTPLDDTLVEGLETVIFTLMPSNTYTIDTNSPVAFVSIDDTTTSVSITRNFDATEPHTNSPISKQTGDFFVNRNDARGEDSNSLTVYYSIGGIAMNGTDYTNISGIVTIPASQPSAKIFIEPVYDNLLEGDESVTLTLLTSGDAYIMNANFVSATISVLDNNSTNVFRRVASLTGPVGIDYHAPSNSVLVSCNQNFGGTNFNFAQLDTNTISGNLVTATTNWSRVRNVTDEIKLLTIKNTGFGFTNGDMFFGSSNAIGWLSADGSRSNLTWCVLTNATQTNALFLRGSICQDETGLFGNDLIAVTSGGPSDGPKGVWRINGQGQPTLLASIVTTHLEGVIVLSNNVAKWGPWAGKIVTGDESTGSGMIYTVDTNGVLTPYDTTTIHPGGIRAEDFEIVPANQDFYACDFPLNGVVKVARTHLSELVGDLMIVDAGEINPPGELFVVRWNAATTNFIPRRIPYLRPNNGGPGLFEHVTFAPLDLPFLNP